MSDTENLRTILANERTVLAYIRTALAILVFGMAAIKFFPETAIAVYLGWAAVGLGLLTLIFGFIQFRDVSRRIKRD